MREKCNSEKNEERKKNKQNRNVKTKHNYEYDKLMYITTSFVLNIPSN